MILSDVFGGVFASKSARYGTTAAGGTANAGTVFELAPPVAAGGQWTETVLHEFGASGDGKYPLAGLVSGASGELYGTTFLGGTGTNAKCFSGACGTVFTLAPPAAAGGTTWTESVIWTFGYSYTYADGGNPAAGVLIGPGGDLFGTTVYGGALGEGSV